MGYFENNTISKPYFKKDLKINNLTPPQGKEKGKIRKNLTTPQRKNKVNQK